jgi:hypothetical protein
VGGAGTFAGGGAVAECCILAHRRIETESRSRERTGCDCPDRGFEHTYVHPDAHATTDSHGDLYLYAYADQHAHADADEYAYFYSDAHGDEHSHSDTDLYTYAYVHADASATHTRWR